MFFKIDPHNGVPVYEQVVRQIVFAVAGGRLHPGELIPSVRQLAKSLAINPNTVARAYRQLQEDQVIESVRGTGMQVTPKAPDRCRHERTKLIRERIASVISEARQSQLDDDEILEIVNRQLSGSTSGGTQKRLKSKGGDS